MNMLQIRFNGCKKTHDQGRFLLALISLLGILLISGCKNKENPVPNVYVNITIDLNEAQFNNLVPGSYKYLTGGVSGIILYRKTFEEFTALERTCPHESEKGTKVSVIQDNSLFVQCSTCESKFYIEDGSVVRGPSEFPLKSYKTMYNGRYLRIYN